MKAEKRAAKALKIGGWDGTGSSVLFDSIATAIHQAEAAAREEEREAMNLGPNWLIYSREHNAFWRPNSSGYTYDIDAAGRYTRHEAMSRCDMRDRQPDGGPSEVAVVAPEAIRARTPAAETAEAVETGDG